MANPTVTSAVAALLDSESLKMTAEITGLGSDSSASKVLLATKSISQSTDRMSMGIGAHSMEKDLNSKIANKVGA